MANRRCFQSLTRYLQSVRAFAPFPQTISPALAQSLGQISASKQGFDVFCNNGNVFSHSAVFPRHFCSRHTDNDNDGEDEDEDEEDYESDEEEKESANLSAEDKVKEAAEIGYRVVGPLQPSERIPKAYEPVFAVVQIGSHQFKVSNGDAIFTEKLKLCEVNDKLILNKILMLGSKTQTIIGRPILPDAVVHALVEEHALDAKVIVFKKKRRKNYRRTKGHRQMLTKLRIIGIEGIEKPTKTTALKTEKKDKPALKTEKKDKPEKKVAVEA